MFIISGIIVSFLSFVTGFAWARMKQVWLAVITACVFPFVAAWVTYWFPLQSIKDTSEYSAWYWVFAISWLMFALPISVATTLLHRRGLIRRRTNAD